MGRREASGSGEGSQGVTRWKDSLRPLVCAREYERRRNGGSGFFSEERARQYSLLVGGASESFAGSRNVVRVVRGALELLTKADRTVPLPLWKRWRETRPTKLCIVATISSDTCGKILT